MLLKVHVHKYLIHQIRSLLGGEGYVHCDVVLYRYWALVPDLLYADVVTILCASQET